MNSAILASRAQREAELLGQTVVVMDGSAGIGQRACAQLPPLA